MRNLLLVTALLASSGQAYASDIAVGWGNIVDPMQSGGIITGAWRTGFASPSNLELRVGVAAPSGTDRVNEFAPLLLDIAASGDSGVAFQLPLKLDRYFADVLVDFAPQREPGSLQVVPRLRVGAGVLMRDSFTATTDSVTNDDGTPSVHYKDLGSEFVLTVPGEVSFEVWFPSNLGLRLSAGSVVNQQLKPQYDPNTPVTEREWVSRPRLDAALIFSLGGA